MNIISQNPVKGILTNFGHMCIWIRRRVGYILGQRSNVEVTTGNDPENRVNAIFSLYDNHDR